jgi:hypothetical protein
VFTGLPALPKSSRFVALTLRRNNGGNFEEIFGLLNLATGEILTLFLSDMIRFD